MSFDGSTLALFAVLVGILALLALLLNDSRGLVNTRGDLLLWAFLRRRGVRRDALVAKIGERGVRTAEMRCSACGSRTECAALLAQGAATPPADCPNGLLFDRAPGREASSTAATAP
jgi:hypothetical protein